MDSPARWWTGARHWYDRATYRSRRRLRVLLDRATPHRTMRWLGWCGLVMLFGLRVYLAGGFYVVAYVWAIYNLNLLIGFLQPRDLTELQEDERLRLPTRRKARSAGSTGDMAASRNRDAGADDDDGIEYRPFVRRLPEFQFWWQSVKSVLLALACTVTRLFDVPVFWPILVLYFLVLFGITMKRQLQHMHQYGYVPFNWGKQRYGGRSSRLWRVLLNAYRAAGRSVNRLRGHTGRKSSGGRVVTAAKSPRPGSGGGGNDARHLPARPPLGKEPSLR